MSLESILTSTLSFLSKFSKKRLLGLLDQLRTRYKELSNSYDELLKQKEELEKKVKEYEEKERALKIKEVNKNSNKPSSKQAEWEDKGVGNDGKGKKKGRGKKGRKGAGNKPKTKEIDRTEIAEVEVCDNCGKDLKDTPPLESTNTRIIEDIAAPQKTEIIKVIQEKKYCNICKRVVTAKSTLALPKASIGLNTTIQLLYMWVSMGLPFTRIALYFQDFFFQKISTAGLSTHVQLVAKVLQPVYNEILEDIRNSEVLHADETGWRVNGKKWWLWVFGNTESAVYTIDKSRGKDVVRRILGEIFLGVLVVDGWYSYLSIICEKQSCMAHLLRKIRKLYASFPQLRSIMKFYLRFRKILKDGERLQEQRKKLSTPVFQKRLTVLHDRLDELLKWRNPNDTLALIIKKVKKQRPRILTFVEHDNVPCHNNFGEYLIRIGVLKRKVSFGSKSAKGATAYAVILSIYTTCKLRGISFPDFLEKSLVQYMKTGKPLSLKKYSQIQHTLDIAA